jgi:aminoacrylate hydrolase
MPTAGINGATLHYELAGSGPPVLLIHGAGVAGSGWGPQVDDLSRDFQCLSFDNRGIGRSTIVGRTLTIAQMAEDARALLDAVGWESAHVAGHSMGGLIAQELAQNAPQRVRSLALLCTFSQGSEAARVTPRILWLGLRTRAGTPAMRRRAFLEMLFPDAFIRQEGALQLAKRVGPLIGRDLAASPPILMRQLGAMRRHTETARLPKLPTLIISAKQDPIARPEYGRRLHQLIAGSHYEEIPGTSHGVTIQMPEVVNAMLRRHLA